MPCIMHAHLPEGIVPRFVEPSSQNSMTSFLIGRGFATWNFCSNCGCHIASIGIEKGNWVVSSSIFTDHGPDNFQIRKHIYSKSTKDGGIAECLKHIAGKEFIDWNPPEDSPEAAAVEYEPEVGEDGKERLRAKCFCGGVSFTISRPTKEVADDGYMSQFISPKDETKWNGCFDTCDDCRLCHGTHIVGWSFIPLAICEPPIKPDLLIGTAKTFQSSEGVLRSFCGNCGATFLYLHADRHPSDRQAVVDLATGVLRAPEGSMAKNWLTWRAKMAWSDDGKGFDKEFFEALQNGMNDWVKKTYGTVDYYNIG